MKLVGKKFENSRLGMEIYVYDIEGKEWFIGNEMSILLGYSNYQKALQQHVWKENKKSIYVKTLENIENTPNEGTPITVNNNRLFVNEVGLYQLIFGSKMPKAREFQKWVFSEVLPSIRKNNYYVDETNITDTQKDKLIKELTQKVNNGSNLLVNNKRRRLNLKECLEDMFPEVEDVYEQFINIMKTNGLLDENSMPTDVFLEKNKENPLFIHNVETTDKVNIRMVLSNLGINKLVNSLYIDEKDNKLKFFK